MEIYKTKESKVVKLATHDKKFLRQLKVFGVPENKENFLNNIY